MMVGKDGIVHLVQDQQGSDYKGMLVCGILFRRESKYRTKWVPKDVPVRSPWREIVAVRTGRRATCLWCVIGKKQCP